MNSNPTATTSAFWLKLLFVSLIWVPNTYCQNPISPEINFESGDPIGISSTGDNVQFSVDNKYLAITSPSLNEIRIYDCSTGRIVSKINDCIFRGVQFSNDFKYLRYFCIPNRGNNTSYETITETFTGKIIFKRNVENSSSFYTGLIDTYSIQGDLGSVDWDKIKLKNLITGDTLRVSASIANVTVDPQKTTLFAMGSKIQLIKLSDLSSKDLKCGGLFNSLSAITSSDVKFSDSSRFILSSTTNGSINTLAVIDLEQDSILAIFNYKFDRTQEIASRLFQNGYAFDSRSGWLALAQSDGLSLHNILTKASWSIQLPKEPSAYQMKIANRGQQLVVWNNRVLKIFNIPTRQAVFDLPAKSPFVVYNPIYPLLYINQNIFPYTKTKILDMQTLTFTDSIRGGVVKVSANGQYTFGTTETSGLTLRNRFVNNSKSISNCTPYANIHLTNDPNFFILEKQGFCDYQSNRSYLLTDFSLWSLSNLETISTQFPPNRVRSLKSLYDLSIQNGNLFYRDRYKIKCINDSLYTPGKAISGQVMALSGRYSISTLGDTIFVYKNFLEVKRMLTHSNEFVKTISIDTLKNKIWVLSNSRLITELNAVPITVYDLNGNQIKRFKITPRGHFPGSDFDATFAKLTGSERLDYFQISSPTDISNVKTVQFYNVKTGALIFQTKCDVNKLSVDYKSKQVVSIRNDSLFVFSLTTGKILRNEQGTYLSVQGPLLSKFNVATNSSSLLDPEKSISLINWTNQKILFTKQVDAFINVTALSPNIKVFAYPTRDHSIIVLSIKDGNKLAQLNGHTNEINSIVFLHNENQLASTSRDGTVKIWSLSHSAETLTISDFFEDGYIVTVPSGYYKCSKNALKQFNFKLSGKTLNSTQFDFQYNRPDLVLKATGSPDTSLVSAYYKAYQKRLQKYHLDESAFTQAISSPKINILNKIPLTTTDNKIDITIQMSDSQYKLKNYHIKVNGVPVFGRGGKSIKIRTNNLTVTESIFLSEGKNVIEFYCLNEKQIKSLTETIATDFIPKSHVQSHIYYLGVGVSRYKNNEYSLHFADKDALDIDSALRKKFQNNASSFVLVNENARKENLFALKKKLITSKVDDIIVFSFSGHGLIDANYDFYLCPYDINIDDASGTGFSYDDLENLLDSIPARRKIIFIDACNSGELDIGETDQININTETQIPHDGRENIREFRKLGLELTRQPLSKKSSFTMMQELFANITDGNGATIISATSGAEFAYEGPEWKNGVFTYCLLQGLVKGLADEDGNGDISVTELQKYIYGKVAYLTKGQQRPTSRQINFDADWVIWPRGGFTK